MNDQPANPINEADLLAFIEDELPEEHEAAVLRALAANPRQARLAQQMRADRDAISSLPEPQAPAGLLKAVDETLEREMLLGLSDGRPTRDGLPVSTVLPIRTSWLKNTALDSRFQKFTLAAAVLLIGAGATLQALKLINAPASTPDQTVASDHPTTSQDQLAAKPTIEPEISEPVAQEPELALISGPEPLPELSPRMSIDEALALAGQGRLMIRVRTTTPVQTRSEIDRLAQRSIQSSSWRMEAQITGTLANAMNPTPPPPSNISTPDTPQVPTYAGEQTPRQNLPELPRQKVINPNLTLPDAHAYIISTPLDAQTLESILTQLDTRTDLHATFEALDEPVIESPLPLDSGSVFWWTRQPTFWTKNVNIPVLVEPASGRD